MNFDSQDKVLVFLQGLCSRPIMYKGRALAVHPLKVSPRLFQRVVCPGDCGACCNLVYTKDWLPTQPHPKDVIMRQVSVDGHRFPILTHVDDTRPCGYIDSQSRCTIHTMNPLACRLPLCHMMLFRDRYVLTTRIYGRGWALTRGNGVKGALCKLETTNAVPHLVKLFEELFLYADHYKVKLDRAKQVMDYIVKGPQTKPIVIE